MALAEKLNEFPPIVEADRNLLPFETWTEYLDALIEVKDIRNLNGLAPARNIAAIGYRSHGEVLSKEEFYWRRARIIKAVYPKATSRKLASGDINYLHDNLSRALAEREKANRFGNLSTIIFIRIKTKKGFEISGYIDYKERLKTDITEFWTNFFKYEKKLLRPLESDLGYYHWRHGSVRNNITRNYIPITEHKRGLIFQNRHDNKYIWPNVYWNPGDNTIKRRIHSPRYIQIELYDHTVRKAC